MKRWFGQLRIVRYLWSKVWSRHLWNDFDKRNDAVIRVYGWRTALTETKCGNRSTITPIPKWAFWDENNE